MASKIKSNQVFRYIKAFFKRLSTKFILLVALILAVSLAATHALLIYRQNQLFLEQLEEKAKVLGKFVALISPDAILSYDFVSLNHFAREISSQRDMVYGVITAPDMTPLTSYFDPRNSHIAGILPHLEEPNIKYIIAALKKQDDMIHMTFPIEYTNDLIGMVLMGVSTSRLRQENRDTIVRQVIGGILIMLFISVCIFWVFRHHVQYSINALMAGAQRIKAGNLNTPVEGFSHNEFGVLTQTFNDMMQQLNNSLSELHELNKHLEDKVEERTLELAQANHEINQLLGKLKQENTRMGAELDISRRIQQMVLPSEEELDNLTDMEIACFMEPADEVGGDYYDILPSEDGLTIGIGDVTGHGLESGVLMLMVQMAVRTLLTRNITDPKTFMDILNRAVFGNIQRMKIDKNLTLTVLSYQRKSGIVHAIGQHEEILVVRANAQVERIDTFPLGFMLGIVVDISDFLSNMQIQLAPGDGVVLYTDGITEAMNPARVQYGVERLSELVSCYWHEPAKEIRRKVIEDVYAHIEGGKLFDDVTLIILKRKSV
jgi:sigma-B regulation protein RsbU (phosphoserine phosphatase)